MYNLIIWTTEGPITTEINDITELGDIIEKYQEIYVGCQLTKKEKPKQFILKK